MKSWILCDLDGTLCDHTHRIQHAHDKNWYAYNQLCGSDQVIKPVYEVLDNFHYLGYKVGLITARPENVRNITTYWLEQHDVPYTELVMRKEDDWRSDHVVKLEAAAARWEPKLVQFVLDDRDGVVAAWRDAGYTCFQVAKDVMPQGWTP